MQRFRLDALQEQAGRLYLQGNPFTGIAYEVRGDRVTANYQVTDGVRGGPAEAWDLARPRVLYCALQFVEPEETNEQFPVEGDYLDGVFFEGIAYGFDEDTGRLLKEEDYRQEPPAPCRKWFRSGALMADFGRVRPDGTWESVRYREDGQICGVQMRTMGWGRTPEGRLRSLRLLPGYPEDDLPRVPCRVDPMLYLAGQGVTDEILERLEDLPCLEQLTLDNTAISARGLEGFHVCTNLKELGTYSKNGFADADVRKLLARLRGCKWDRRR
jgi:hypothetical protein